MQQSVGMRRKVERRLKDHMEGYIEISSKESHEGLLLQAGTTSEEVKKL